MNIEELNREVGEEYGKVLPLKVVEGEAPNFDWNSVNIPKDTIDKMSKGDLKNIIRHEYGHLFINPRNLATSETMVYLAKLLRYNNPMVIVNVISDMLVDSTLIKIHGREYLKTIEKFLKNPKNAVFVAMSSFYAAYAKTLNLETNLPEDPIGKKIHKVLYGSGNLYMRVYKTMELLRWYLDIPSNMPKYSVSIISVKEPNEASARRELERNGIRVDTLGDRGAPGIFGAGSRSLFRVSSNPKYVAMVEMEIEKIMDEKVSSEKEMYDYGTWYIGDEPRKLDLLRTVENGGLPIPGVTTISREASKDRGPEALGIDSVAVVLDCSGSMEDKFIQVQMAVLNLLEMAKKNRFRVALIPYSAGYSEEYVIYPTFDYEEIRNLLLRIRPSGGTVMAPAIKLAVSMEPDFVLVITDSHISDVAEAVSLLRDIRKRIFVVEYFEDMEGWVEDMEDVYFVTPQNLSLKTKEEVV